MNGFTKVKLIDQVAYNKIYKYLNRGGIAYEINSDSDEYYFQDMAKRLEYTLEVHQSVSIDPPINIRIYEGSTITTRSVHNNFSNRLVLFTKRNHEKVAIFENIHEYCKDRPGAILNSSNEILTLYRKFFNHLDRTGLEYYGESNVFDEGTLCTDVLQRIRHKDHMYVTSCLITMDRPHCEGCIFNDNNEKCVEFESCTPYTVEHNFIFK